MISGAIQYGFEMEFLDRPERFQQRLAIL